MNLNLTLLGQAISFAIFVFLCMKYIWPPIIKGLNERKNKIAAGLSDAEQSRRDLIATQQKIAQQLELSKKQANAILEQAKVEENVIIEQSKKEAIIVNNRLIEKAKNDIAADIKQAKVDLELQFADLVASGVTKVVERVTTREDHAKILADFTHKL